MAKERLKPITPDEMRRIEEWSEGIGVSRLLLMENAGRGISDLLRRRLKSQAKKRVLVVAGIGNNGGDGFVAARHLSGYGAEVSVLVLGEFEKVRTPEASTNLNILLKIKDSLRLFSVKNREELLGCRSLFDEADVIVDAIFGTGIKGPMGEPHASAIDMINTSRAYRLAVDVPSGLDPLTGEVHDTVVRADCTITFHAPKKGFIRRREYVGSLVVAPLGLPRSAQYG